MPHSRSVSAGQPRDDFSDQRRVPLLQAEHLLESLPNNASRSSGIISCFPNFSLSPHSKWIHTLADPRAGSIILWRSGAATPSAAFACRLPRPGYSPGDSGSFSVRPGNLSIEGRVSIVKDWQRNSFRLLLSRKSSLDFFNDLSASQPSSIHP